MIPSRPLNLGEILGESFLIARRTWWRAALVMLLLIPLPSYILYVGASGLVDDLHHTLQAQRMLEPQKVEQFRVDFLKAVKKIYPIYYQLYFSGAKESITHLVHIQDSSAAAVVTDSSQQRNLMPLSHNVAEFFSEHASAFSASFWLIAFGLLFYGILSLAGEIIIVDIACRSFEQRALNMAAAIRDTFTRNLWVNFVQYMILIFVMMFGLGMTITIASFLPAILSALFILAGFCLVIYSFIRLVFAPLAIVSEGLGPVKALQRSWALTAESFWRIVGISIVVMLCFVIITTLVSIPVNLIFSGELNEVMAFILGKTSDVIALFTHLNHFIANYIISSLITSALFASLTPSFLTVFYYDLRTRKDGPLDYSEDEVVVNPS